MEQFSWVGAAAPCLRPQSARTHRDHAQEAPATSFSTASPVWLRRRGRRRGSHQRRPARQLLTMVQGPSRPARGRGPRQSRRPVPPSGVAGRHRPRSRPVKHDRRCSSVAVKSCTIAGRLLPATHRSPTPTPACTAERQRSLVSSAAGKEVVDEVRQVFDCLGFTKRAIDYPPLAFFIRPHVHLQWISVPNGSLCGSPATHCAKSRPTRCPRSY